MEWNGRIQTKDLWEKGEGTGKDETGGGEGPVHFKRQIIDYDIQAKAGHVSHRRANLAPVCFMAAFFFGHLGLSQARRKQ